MYRKIVVGYDGANQGRDALALAQTLRAADCDWLELHPVPGDSPAHGLHVFSERVEADLVVVGSSHRAHHGRVHAGSRGERLLNGRPARSPSRRGASPPARTDRA